MMRSSTKIPVNKQKVTAVGGLDVIYLDSNAQQPKALNDHRDEYYILAVVIKGAGLLKCDMGDIDILPRSIIFIKPYQVHSGNLDDENSEGYFLSIAPFLMPDFCKDLIDNLGVSEQSKRLTALEMEGFIKTVELLHQAFNADNIYKVPITINLMNALVIHACSFFPSLEQMSDQKRSQGYTLTQDFKKLVLQYSFQHTPSFFAEKLHISTSHLNDCIKASTGLSVTQFLQNTMLLEAKRQLYYTNADVKIIAFTLGFEDHTYFSRLFKKLTNETPLAFRSRFRE
ncbi:MAG TPA: helix-turn-helix transcriptional regulator [Pedobacter sp.]